MLDVYFKATHGAGGGTAQTMKFSIKGFVS